MEYVHYLEMLLLTRTHMLPHTYSIVPKMGLAKLMVGFAVQPIQKSEAVMNRPPIIAGSNLYSISTMPSGLFFARRWCVILSSEIDVAAARIEPTIAAMNASPAC